MEWAPCIERLRSYVVRIETPEASGSGFMFFQNERIAAIATAKHVVERAHFWKFPIQIKHAASSESIMLESANTRAILFDENGPADTAVIIVERASVGFLPVDPLTLAPSKNNLKVGFEIGWLGFPAIAPNDLCFFSGRISAWRASRREYFVDGVAINGVSGGPVFFNGGDEESELAILGVVSAYIPNRSTGAALPGLAIVTDVEAFHSLLGYIKTLDEASAKQVQPDTPPPPPPTSSAS